MDGDGDTDVLSASAFGDEVAILCRDAAAAEVLWLRPDRLGAWVAHDGELEPRAGDVPEGYYTVPRVGSHGGAG